MKKYNIGFILVGFFLIGLFVARFFWSSVSAQTDGESQKLAKLANGTNVVNGAGGKPSTQGLSEVKSDSASVDKSVAAAVTSGPESEDIDLLENKRELSPLEDCFERLRRQKETVHFLQKNKEKLDQVIYPWILDADEIKNLRFPTLKNPGSLEYFNYLYRGLLAAGLLSGAKLPQPLDLSLVENVGARDQAVYWLNKATELESNNAAAWVFLALVYESAQQPDHFSKVIKNLESSKYFQTGITNATRYLYLQMQDGSDFLDVNDVVTDLPIPNYTALMKLIIKHKLNVVADLMVKSNDYSVQLKNNIPITEFVDFVLIEYAIGLSALKYLKVPNQYTPMKEYAKLSRDMRKKNISWDDDELIKNCDLKTLERSMHVLKKNLQNARLKIKNL